MKQLARKIAKYVLSVVLRPFYSGLGCVVCLHRIAPKSTTPRLDNTALELDAADLDALLAYLVANNYAVVSMNEVYEILTAGRTGKRFVALTFDDCYLDTHAVAYPIFKKHNLPFAVYITTSFVDNTNALWWYRLEHFLLKQYQVTVPSNKRLDVASLEQKKKVFDSISATIRTLPPVDHRQFLHDLFQPETEFHKTNLAMNWEQIKELASDPLVTIGAHSVNHLDLNKLTDQEIVFELDESRRIIESQIGRKVEHFSYPFGGRSAVNEREFAIAKTCNFKTMITTRAGNLFPGHARHLESLPRIGVSNNYPVLPRFKLFDSGVLPALEHRFQRVVTV